MINFWARVSSIDDETRSLIMRREDANLVRTRAIEKGMKTLFQDGLAKVLVGETTIEEIQRVAL